MPSLADVAEISPGFDRTLIRALDEVVSFVPMASISETSGSVTSEEPRVLSDVLKGFTSFRDRDVLVAKITPCFENGKIAHARIKTRFGFGSTEFHVVRPHADKLDDRYLFHFLRQPQIREAGERRMTGSGGQRRVPRAFLADLAVPLPPLPEQRRIAAILDKADALRAKRRVAIAKFDQLLQSVFLDMFGAKEFDIVPLQDLLPSAPGAIRTGPFGSQLLHSEFVEAGVAVLGIDNAVQNVFAQGKPRFITEDKYRALARYRVKAGDVLITIMGTCGRCAVVPDDVPVAINTKHLCCITLDRNKCMPDFLHSYFLMHPTARRFLSDRAKGAIMDGLNMGIVKELPVQVPPLSQQQKFVAIKKALADQRSHLETHNEQLSDLVTALQAQAFAGAR